MYICPAHVCPNLLKNDNTDKCYTSAIPAACNAQGIHN